jgi:large subunit ribosomal protein L19e
MKLNLQKRLATKVAKAGINRVRLDYSKLSDLREAITRSDIKRLIEEGAIKILQRKTPSRQRAIARNTQKKKGRQRGPGKKKGKKLSKVSKKERWMNKVRPQRKILKSLKETGRITNATYYDLYKKSSGGFFRNRSHLLFYMKQNKLFEK